MSSHVFSSIGLPKLLPVFHQCCDLYCVGRGRHWYLCRVWKSLCDCFHLGFQFSQ
ncbi:hypothetical protein PILCRDRAFT_221530 [Piloderma croceum F 1598]|uniref:Uncharacterized protein n=1 Tax=Piloderma croceum (strain F 1598) TaxID=765440 RepID=A0A0C3BS39_PILCF|nr:hypothetical protein PILCRDRAFT_221530 [Piloderma croceum F 1598]